MLKGGSYANRVRTHVDRCHKIPDSMSFEEAATLPSVYLCSLYSMYHMANLKEGQVRSVFKIWDIHRANGWSVCSYPLGNWWCRNCLYSIGPVQESRGTSS